MHTTLRTSLNHHTVELTISIEVRCVETTEITLHHSQYRRWRDTCLLGLGNIYIHHILRIVRVILSLSGLNLRTLVQLSQELLHIIKELIQVTTGLILHGHGNTILHRETGNHRWSKGKHLCILDSSSLLVDHTQYRGILHRVDKQRLDTATGTSLLDTVEESTRTLLEWLQLHDDGTLVRTGTTDKAITHDGVTGCDGWVASQHLIYLLNHLCCTFLRSTRSCRDTSEDSTGILIRHQTRLGCTHQGNQTYDADSHEATSDDAMIDNPLDTTFILIGNLIKLIVESCVETIHERHLLLVTLLVWLQQHGTERRRQSQRVDSRNNDRYRHGYTELTVEVTGSTTDE